MADIQENIFLRQKSQKCEDSSPANKVLSEMIEEF